MEFDIKKFVNSNQNTVRQSTFFSTKRKPRNLKLCMAKPTEEEKSKYKHDENVYSFMTGTQNIENKPGPEKVKSDNKLKILKLFGIKKMHFDKIGCDDFVLPEGYPLPQIINVQSSEQSEIYSQVKLGLRSFRVFQILMNRGHVLSVHNLNGQIWLVVINAMIGITGYVCQTYQMFLENPKPGPVATVF